MWLSFKKKKKLDEFESFVLERCKEVDWEIELENGEQGCDVLIYKSSNFSFRLRHSSLSLLAFLHNTNIPMSSDFGVEFFKMFNEKRAAEIRDIKKKIMRQFES